MVRALIVIAIVIGLPPSAFALEGRVQTPSGAPVAGARVCILGVPGSALTGRNGSFSLPGAPRPPFKLLVTRPDGVALAPVQVQDVPAGAPLVVVAPSYEDSVTVISGVVPDLELPPAAAATVIGREDLDERLPLTLSDVLENVPGTSRGEEGLSVVPGIRGMPKGRTLILLDGARVSAERRAGPSASYLDPATVEEVEVVRGPGSVAYGSDAFGGVIRARSRMPHPGEPLSVRYQLLGSDLAAERGAAVEVAGEALGGAVLVGAHYRELGDYESPRGRVPDSGGVTKGFRLAYQTTLGEGVLRAGWRTDLGREIGKPASDAAGYRRYYPEETSQRLDVSYDAPGPGSWSRVSATGAWGSYRLVLDKETFAASGRPREVARSDVDADDYELRLEAERRLDQWRLVVGVNAYGRYGLEAVNRALVWEKACCATVGPAEVSVASARKDDVGAYVGLGGRAGVVALAGGVRVDRVSTSNRGGYFGTSSVTQSDVSGFTAATVPLVGGLELSLQAARGFRAPLLSDRYYRGLSGRGYITGNPELEPETSRQFDLALRTTGWWVDVAAYAYVYRIANLIERYKEGSDYFFRNRGEAELRGVEIEATAPVGRSVVLQLGLQSPRGEVLDDGNSLDDIPAQGGFVVLRQAPRQGWWWLARLAAFRRDRRPGPTETFVPGFSVVDVGGGWTLSPGAEVQVLVRNVLDRAYVGSADAAAVLAPGRSVTVVLRGRV